MNRSLASTRGKQSVSSSVVLIGKQLIMMGTLAVIASAPAMAQNAELQQKLAAVKQAAAENKQQLHQYQWVETTQLTLKGDQKPSSQKLCQYGPDGQIQKTPIGPPPEQPSGGRMKQRVIAKKKEEMQDYMGDVKDPPQHVRTTRPSKNAASLSGWKSLIESCWRPRELNLHGLCSAWRSHDACIRHRLKENRLLKRQYVHGRSERCSDVAGADG